MLGYMAIVLAYQSACEFWRIQQGRPKAHEGLPWPGGSRFSRTIRTSIPELRAFVASSALPLSLPLHLMVPSAAQRVHSPLAVSHVCTQTLPRGALYRLDDESYVVSPEWCYLQMATRYDEIGLAELGSELCARFAFGFGECDSLPKRTQLTTPQRLRSFAERSSGSHGRQRAIAAAQFIRPAAESPMEITAVLLYCLTGRLGGYKIPVPRLNDTIAMSARVADIAPTSTMRADLRWNNTTRGRSVIVEVNSRKHHASDPAWYKDSVRNNALTFNSDRLYLLTTPQIVRLSEVERLARILSHDLGVRLPKKTPVWQSRQASLHRRLTDFSRWKLPNPLWWHDLEEPSANE